MIKRLSFGVVTLAFSMACSGSSPTAPTPVAAAPAPPAAPVAQIVSLSIHATRDVMSVNNTTVLTAFSNWDDGSVMPITPTWEVVTGPVTLLGNGPVALVTSQGLGIAAVTARAAGKTQTKLITIIRQQ